MASQFSKEQQQNAAVIAQVGRKLGASERDITIALMTALQESGLRNINYGDRDSIGLFQQRDAWGTTAQRMDPTASAMMFFTGGHGGQRGLFDFKNRESLSLTQAAQAVQVSAFPDAYAKHESAARALLGNAPASSGGSISTGSEPNTPLGAPIPGATITLNPTVDRTAGALAAEARAAEGQVDPLTSATVGRATDPVGRANAPGARAGAPVARADGTTDPYAGAADEVQVEPDAQPKSLTMDQFKALFPDSASTRQFSDPDGSNAIRSDVVSAALQWQGVNYVWGGESKDGADCSGFLKTLFAGFGVDLPRLSADQARFGQRVGMDEVRPGDILAIDNSPRNLGADHVALALGGGWIMELPRPGLAGRKRRIGAGEEGWYGVRIPQLG